MSEKEKAQVVTKVVMSTVANNPDLFIKVLARIKKDRSNLERLINRHWFNKDVSHKLDRIIFAFGDKATKKIKGVL